MFVEFFGYMLFKSHLHLRKIRSIILLLLADIYGNVSKLPLCGLG